MKRLGGKTKLALAFALVAMAPASPTVYAEQLTSPSIDASGPAHAADIGCGTPAGQTPATVQPVAALTLPGNCTPQSSRVHTPHPDGTSGIDREPAPSPFGLRATLYITTNRDSGRDSIGCRVVPMRTVAVDGRIVKRHSVLFIKETVGLKMPDGTTHDGYWYATDVGSAIHAGRIDLYTGKGRATIKPLLHLNLRTLTVTRVGQFAGCPARDGAPISLASN